MFLKVVVQNALLPRMAILFELLLILRYPFRSMFLKNMSNRIDMCWNYAKLHLVTRMSRHDVHSGLRVVNCCKYAFANRKSHARLLKRKLQSVAASV